VATGISSPSGAGFGGGGKPPYNIAVTPSEIPCYFRMAGKSPDFELRLSMEFDRGPASRIYSSGPQRPRSIGLPHGSCRSTDVRLARRRGRPSCPSRATSTYPPRPSSPTPSTRNCVRRPVAWCWTSAVSPSATRSASARWWYSAAPPGNSRPSWCCATPSPFFTRMLDVTGVREGLNLLDD